jgi:hypothetical protein
LANVLVLADTLVDWTDVNTRSTSVEMDVSSNDQQTVIVADRLEFVGTALTDKFPTTVWIGRYANRTDTQPKIVHIFVNELIVHGRFAVRAVDNVGLTFCARRLIMDEDACLNIDVFASQRLTSMEQAAMLDFCGEQMFLKMKGGTLREIKAVDRTPYLLNQPAPRPDMPGRSYAIDLQSSGHARVDKAIADSRFPQGRNPGILPGLIFLDNLDPNQYPYPPTPGLSGPGYNVGQSIIRICEKVFDHLSSMPSSVVNSWSELMLNAQLRTVQQWQVGAGSIASARRAFASAFSFSSIPRNARGQAAMDKLGAIEKSLGLRVRELGLQDPSGMPRSIEVFAEGLSVKNGMAPTEALVIDSAVGGRQGLGLMEFDPRNPNEIVLTFTVQMTIDPWLRQRVNQKLEKEGEELEGVFGKWNLTPRKIDFEGVDGDKSKVTVVGDKLVCRLVLDSTNKGRLAFYQLSQGIGLPVSFDWVYKDDLNIRGKWEGVRLSFGRRERPELAVTGGKVSNHARVPVTIYYCRAGEQFVPIIPALRLEPQSEAALPLPTNTDLQNLVIPPEAVAYNVDPDSYRSDFYSVTGDESVEWVTITNLLAPYDEARQENLRYVEVKLTYALGEGANAKEVILGPIKLAPKESVGSEVSLPFLRAKAGNVSFTLSGIAYYGLESSQTLKTQTVSGAVIKISQQSLTGQ